MSSIAYVRLTSNDTELFTYFDTSASERFSGYTYKLGDILLNLLDLDIEDVRNKYIELLVTLSGPALKADYDALADIRQRINQIDEAYPALWFHTRLLYYCYGDVFTKDTITISQDLFSLKNAQVILDTPEFRLLKNGMPKSLENITLYFSYIVRVLIADISYWKATVQNEMLLIFEYSSFDYYKQLSPAQRLYFLDRVEDRIARFLPFTYVDYSFKTRMILADRDSAVLSIKPDERAEQIFKADISLNEMYSLNSLQDYVHFELIKFVLSGLP
ncbi:MAG: hypothetical protein AAGU75_18495, partial [Bacillota bacterium]